MIASALNIINYGIILIFGVLLSADFSGISKTTKNQRAKFCFIFVLLLLQCASWQLFGIEITKKLYPIIVHIPLAVFFITFYKTSYMIAFVSVLSAYLCCQTPQWVANVTLYIFNNRLAYDVVYLLIIFFTLYFVKKYVVYSVNQLMSLSRRSLLLFSIVPLMYYLFDYITVVYTNLLYSGSEMAVHFMPALVSTFYFVFVNIHYSEMQKRSTAENESILLAIQLNQSKKEFTALYEADQKTSIYRHDMRHHLSLLEGYLSDGDIPNAISYIKSAQADIDYITPIHYCDNHTVNLILSSFVVKAKKVNVNLSFDISLPEELKYSDTELCTLLSNGLENAIIATAQVKDQCLRTIRVNCKTHKNNLLIFLENYFSGEVIIENGLPKSLHKGHGFGVKSIAMIVKKNNGYYSFTAINGIFTLKIVLPLEEGGCP